MGNEDIQTLLRTGIQAAQSGNKAAARRLLEQVVEQDPNNELAWMWMASVVESAAERRSCLQKVLAINPNNERARQALDKLPQETPPPRRETPAPRLTPHLEELLPKDTITRSIQERDDLLAALEEGSERKRSLWPVLLALLAIVMIAGGIVILVSLLQDEEGEPTATSTRLAAGAPPTSQTREPDFPTVTPPGGTIVTIPAIRELPPTWTPTVTSTPLSLTPIPTLLPLGEYTLLVSGKRSDETTWNLYTLLADGTQEQAINIDLRTEVDTDTTEEAPALVEFYDAAFSPDGEQIVFTVRLSSEIEELFIAPADGGRARQLTTLEAANTRGAVWSPDGSQIVFTSDADGDYDLYLAGPDGGESRPITTNTTDDRDPTWSPDGQFIAFASDQTAPGFLQIWRMTPEGVQPEQLTEDTNSSYAPAWSPDGTMIAFISDRRVDNDLYVMNADGSGERVLTSNDDGAEDRDPAWSPDGTWIAFCSDLGSPTLEISLIHPDGTERQQITTRQGENRYLAWKP